MAQYKQDSIHEIVDMPDKNLGMKIFRHQWDGYGNFIYNHWHEQIEFMYFEKGEVMLQCADKSFGAAAGDMVAVNSNELHFGHVITPPVSLCAIIIDISLFRGSLFAVNKTRYFLPMFQNDRMFVNKIGNDILAAQCIHNIFCEYEHKKIGYELAIEASVYNLLTLLLRNYTDRTLPGKEYSVRLQKLERMGKVIKYINSNYSEDINIDQLAGMVNMSRFYFCHQFKKLTNKSLSEYVNNTRINEAERLLKNSDMNITEAAAASGFSNVSYFSRLFKSCKGYSPSSVIKSQK